ncbi:MULTISPECIES: hypothetical protein [Sphingomonas]|uniref:Uncharacterized protein n=1 Tax=Sphingomonas kyungheensis TaxID=1069987 RepID=A0ABU8GYV2_9SPHN|nr:MULTISPECIES: hypothetical protein [unclassified Sphingomonas]EZP52937.1 hypothetical protein BW41_02113 [Sphingomonas sp. RIT328]
MTEADTVFALRENDHLTRIHLKLALEDIGFVVDEDDVTIHLRGAPQNALASLAAARA